MIKGPCAPTGAMSDHANDDEVRCIINIDKITVFIIFKNEKEGKNS